MPVINWFDVEVNFLFPNICYTGIFIDWQLCQTSIIFEPTKFKLFFRIMCKNALKLRICPKNKKTKSYSGSIPCITISFCVLSIMSWVNMALKYGTVAAKTIRWALNDIFSTCNVKIVSIKSVWQLIDVSNYF